MRPHRTFDRTFGRRTLGVALLGGVAALAPACGDSDSDAEQASTPVVDPGRAPTSNPLAGGSSAARDPHAGIPGMGSGAGGTVAHDGPGVVVHGVLIMPPESWKREPTASSMRAAQYRVPPAEGEVIDATLVVFQGIGGTPEDNIQRWIGQITDKTETPVRETVETEDGLTISTIRMVGTYSVGSMMGGSGTPEPDSIFLGAVISGAEESFPVFLRLVGPRASIEPHLDQWDAMIASIERAP